MQQAYEQLEFNLIISALRARCQSELGKERTERMTAFETAQEAINNIRQIDQMRTQLDEDRIPPLGGAQNVSLDLEQATKEMVLEGPQLIAIAKTMAVIADLQNYLLPLDTVAPLLFGMGASLSDLSRPSQKIIGSFEPSGRLADHASSDLASLRHKMRSIEDNVQETLRKLIDSLESKQLLQEPYFTVRAERYVLPVIASFKGKVEGIVHDASNTGQTVFIEPQAILKLGNKLKIAQSDVREEEFRILTLLSDIVKDHASDISRGMEIVAQVDVLFASSKFAIDLNCEPIEPNTEQGIDLIDARHPLLVLQKIAEPTAPLVANDIGLHANQRVLILTGPNTGGKTVAMKTVGLLALMLRCGLHLPCKQNSSLGWFQELFVAIGDQQSIESKLSTFAAHIKTLSQIVDGASPNSLVLIDEIAADTDPTQGQALGHAILESLAEKRSHVVVTTHFEGLKAIPFANDQFRNAGVGFDNESFKPTYKVSLDVPQSSNGFDIARGLGMNNRVVERAQQIFGDGSSAIEELISAVENKANELEKAKDETKQAERQLEKERNRLEHERHQLKAARQKLQKQAQEELFDEIKTAREQVSKIISELQRSAGSDAVKAAMRVADKASKELKKIDEEKKDEAKKLHPPEPKTSPLSEVQVGDWVHVPKVGQDGNIVSIDKKGAVVAIGNMRLRVGLESLRTSKTRPAKNQPSRRTSTGPKKNRSKIAAVSSNEELDVRGLTSDEALDRLDAFLDYHFQGPCDFVRVIHGHGTGALRKAIRDHLRTSGYVVEYRPESDKNGGDGATLIELS
ncbi:MAG: endonuclease MutS2 [Myxococcota bacterium]|nr:endonuclease MutS2 [Myxococcota bacterium]